MVFDILIPLSCGGVGLFLGWVMHALHRSGLAHVPSDDDRPTDEPIREKATSTLPAPEIEIVSPEKINSVASRIRAFAANLAASIDSHQTRIDAVSSSLNANDLSTTSPVVLQAVEQLLSANELMRTELEESQQRLREQSKELQTATQRAQTDSLTGLTNRGSFDEQLLDQHAKGARQAGVLVLADIDHFKAFNDAHGHRCGDAVLRSVASMLEARLEPYGKVARFGGEEFAVLINDEDFEETVDLIEQTRQAVVNREIRFEGKRLRVSMSVGIGRLGENATGDQQSPEEWLQKVDDALYRSKEAGRDCAHFVQGERFIRVGRCNASSRIPANAAVGDLSEIGSSESGSLIVDTNVNVDSKGVMPAVETSLSVDSRNETRRLADWESNSDAVDPAIAITQATAEVSGQPIGDLHAHPERDETEQIIEELTAQLASAKPTKPPKGLAYLPEVDAMIDCIAEEIQHGQTGHRPLHLLALTLSGHPNGATMRSLLQIVRAALRSQDRIGCLNHSTLLVCVSDCAEAEVIERTAQVCHSAGAVGVQLASKERTSEGERLSAGIVQLATAADTGNSFEPDPHSIEGAILQTRVTAIRAGQQSIESAPLPILTQAAEVRGLEESFV